LFFFFAKIKNIDHNVCHGSDTIESAIREIALWFTENSDGD